MVLKKINLTYAFIDNLQFINLFSQLKKQYIEHLYSKFIYIKHIFLVICLNFNY